MKSHRFFTDKPVILDTIKQKDSGNVVVDPFVVLLTSCFLRVFVCVFLFLFCYFFLREGTFFLGGGRAGEFWYLFPKKVLALPCILIKKLLTPPPHL